MRIWKFRGEFFAGFKCAHDRRTPTSLDREHARPVVVDPTELFHFIERFPHSDAASAPPAFPALGAASFSAPRYFAIETATLIPRALKLWVGLMDSSLIQRSTSTSRPNFSDCSSGVPPSPKEMSSPSLGSGNNSR